MIKELPAKASARVAAADGWPGGACSPESAVALLAPLESRILASARDRLGATIADAAKQLTMDPALLVHAEQNIQGGLTAMHLYSSDVLRALQDPKDAACDGARQSIAKMVRDDVRAQIVAVATARRGSIERYEDALSGVLDIASEK